MSWDPHALSLVERRRAQAILQRIRALSGVFAFATIAWIPVDALLFEGQVAWLLAATRVLAALALLLLARAPAPAEPAPTMADARRATVLLFTVPAFFYTASLQIFHLQAFGAIATIVVSAYSFVPFLMAAAIAAFPLTFPESAALLLVGLVAEVFALQWHGGETRFVTAEALWLQLLIGAVASFAAFSQRRLLAELVAQADKDPLTGCHRRESGRELLNMHSHLARRRAAPLAVLFMDLDEFKRVNDQLGHEAGDRALVAAAAAMRSDLRLSDVLVRWGGEEFVMILPDTRLADAVAIAERVRTTGACTVEDGSRLTMSIGVAERMEDGVDDPDVLVELADRRMYRAKQAGRNRCVSTGGFDRADIAAA